MCGIAGFTGEGQLEDLQAMTARLSHRGPDADGFWNSDRVFLGHRRLSIIDVACGEQPMWTADGQLGVVFNGEIYNHAELRAELQARGAVFETDHSDTEVLLHGYREWGEKLPEQLNGMWAFVILDRKARRLFGSRDRFGKKPFYYQHDRRGLVFSSELRSLLAHPNVQGNLSALSLQKYFAYCYIPAPRSIYENVWKLPGGHSFTLDLTTNDLHVRKYWDFVLEPETPPNAEETWCEGIRDLLHKAVKRRLMSDVPLGIFLSGGLDSSAVAAFAARELPKGALNTFSIGFSEASFDESAYAEQVAGFLGTRHRSSQLDLDRSRELLPEIVSRLDEPIGDGSLLPTFLLSKFTREHVTVALGGDGGDELFAGYDPFKALKKAELYQRLVPRPMHQAIRLLAARLPVSHENISLDFKIKRTLSGLSYPPPIRNAVWMGALEPRELPNFFCEPAKMEEVYSEAIETWDRCAQANVVDRTLQFFTQLYLQDNILAKVDRASMMTSLEARSPFLDIDLVNLARTIPHEFKLRHGTTKYILKKALEPILPHAIIYRKKKGFGMPIGRWMREGGFSFDEKLPPMVNAEFAAGKLRSHLADKSDERLFLWNDWLLRQWAATGER